jgi:hypothetical protein
MKISRTILQVLLLVASMAVVGSTSMGQDIGRVTATAPVPPDTVWKIDVAFSESPKRGIDVVRLQNLDDSEIITLTAAGSIGFVYSYTAAKALELKPNQKTGKLELAKHYQVIADIKNNTDGKPNVLAISNVILNDNNRELNKEQKVEAKSVDASDIYLSGEVNGAHGEKTRYSTQIKLQKPFLFDQNRLAWRHRPFFKLNASTDPDADPDKMEMGWAVDYVANSWVFANAVKLESERDFDNTNLIYDTRFSYLPRAFPKGADKRVHVFLNPFVGGEFGKNLKSPLKAAEGDGIARLLAGADVRLGFFLKEDSDEPEINWTTTYERRWLLTDELRFKTDKDDNLVLVSFGKSPRDYVSSKVSYKISKFFETFLEYEWGQVPPSYKLVDHRFRLGFAYKFKFGVK